MLETHELLPAEHLLVLARPISELLDLMTPWERSFCLSLPEWGENPRWCVEQAMKHAPYPRLYYSTDIERGVMAFADTLSRDTYCAERDERPMPSWIARRAMMEQLRWLDATHGYALSHMPNARLWSMLHHLL